MLQWYTWQGRTNNIINVDRQCEFCVEKSKSKMAKMSYRVPEGINDIVGIDLMVNDDAEYRYIVVIVMFMFNAYREQDIKKY